jgi:hypothetical protein
MITEATSAPYATRRISSRKVCQSQISADVDTFFVEVRRRIRRGKTATQALDGITRCQANKRGQLRLGSIVGPGVRGYPSARDERLTPMG